MKPTLLTYSLPLLENPGLTVLVAERVPRAWRERLLTWPWRPWQATRVVTRRAPDPRLYRVLGCVVGHPATLEKFRARLLKQRLN